MKKGGTNKSKWFKNKNHLCLCMRIRYTQENEKMHNIITTQLTNAQYMIHQVFSSLTFVSEHSDVLARKAMVMIYGIAGIENSLNSISRRAVLLLSRVSDYVNGILGLTWRAPRLWVLFSHPASLARIPLSSAALAFSVQKQIAESQLMRSQNICSSAMRAATLSLAI